ncbi:MAG: 4-hydroxy-tetrahydrodipicolinate synthase [Anaerolineales bacterium]|nr:MAG: 4-hydroxy-tetrahydrodipicolinate synthase [Anaerolineales bacterium]
MKKLRGVYAVMLTPFKEDESVDEETLRSLINWLVGKGVHGIICTGSTGEFASLSDEERRSVVDITVQESHGRVPVLVGSAANSTRHTILYSQYAESVGADGLMIVHPYYCQPNQEELYEHYKAVARSVHIPIMIYNNPATSGVDMQPELLARLAEIDNISYVKEASGDIRRIGQIRRLCGDRISIFVGCDNTMLESWLMGAEGWVSGVANILPQQSVELFELADRGEIDRARELYDRMLPLGDMLDLEGSFVQYLKAGSEILGRPLGKPRRPMLPPREGDLRRLKKAIELIISPAEGSPSSDVL